MVMLDSVRRLLDSGGSGVSLVVVEGDGLGTSAVISAGGDLLAGDLPAGLLGRVAADALALLDREQTATVDYPDFSLFVEPIVPPPSLLVFGAVHIAQSLAVLAQHLGYRVTVSDSRPVFVTAERFPTADELLVGWPDRINDRLVFDARTFVVVLSHDARFEDPLWPMVQGTPVRYVGAMGSTKTAEARRNRLQAAGWSETELSRIHGPIGIDIGAVTPGEVAVAILAEMTSARYRRGEPLDLSGEIRRLDKSAG
jgi:xanthine dehydrogenase accessory factor